MITVRLTCGEGHVWQGQVKDGAGGEVPARHRHDHCPECHGEAVAVATVRSGIELAVATFTLVPIHEISQAIQRVRRPTEDWVSIAH